MTRLCWSWLPILSQRMETTPTSSIRFWKIKSSRWRQHRNQTVIKHMEFYWTQQAPSCTRFLDLKIDIGIAGPCSWSLFHLCNYYCTTCGTVIAKLASFAFTQLFIFARLNPLFTHLNRRFWNPRRQASRQSRICIHDRHAFCRHVAPKRVSAMDCRDTTCMDI